MNELICSNDRAKEILFELFADGKNHSIIKIRDSVSQTHCDRGGLPIPNRYPVKYALTSLKKLGKAENPVEGYWRISDNLVPLEYKYENIPLKPQITREIICELLFSGQEIKTRDIRDKVLQHHLDRGGENVLSDKLRVCVKGALTDLSKKGIVSNGASKGFWVISSKTNREQPKPVVSKVVDVAVPSLSLSEVTVDAPLRDFSAITCGSGSGVVYVFCFPSQRDHAKIKGEHCFNCNIGFTEKNSWERVKEQTRNHNEEPELLLIFRTDDPRALEKAIHAVLDLHGKRTKKNKKSEWFITNPREVLGLYRRITDVFFIYDHTADTTILKDAK